ncbi:hypothetical protein QWY31_11750 [Cytophagales bacterium LB-30]|uniref:DUF3185 family protein n=1 Tax=Shiella aurantiaca TaxID=3058365 RepID=A0ABT8F7J0_9BACT|nr:hypothetical protein [Shiella aurantiaca]MDN4166181.1 hypothetical protein [Shiella aurantiaca]
MKKSIGTLLVIGGLLVGGLSLTQQTEDNTLLEVGSVSIKKDRTENVNWMMIGGGISLLIGIVLVAAGSKR